MSIESAAKCEIHAVILEFLEGYELDCDNFLNSIVTENETWVAHYTPETKKQSEQWCHTTSPSTRKFKTTIPAKKIMVSVFWDYKGIIFIEYIPRRETINAARYCDLKKKLRRAIQNKRRGLLTSGVCLLQGKCHEAILGPIWMGCFEPPPVFPLI